MVKIGFMGLGLIAQLMHLPYLTATEGGGVPGAEVVAIYDVVPPLVEAIGKRYHIEGQYTDYNEFLERDDIEAVVILTPSTEHARCCIDALNAGKHVFVEKPLALNVKDVERIIEAQKKNGRFLQVGYMKRHSNGFQIAMEEFKKMENIKLIKCVSHSHGLFAHHKLLKKEIKFPVSKELIEKASAERQRQIIEELGSETTPLEMSTYYWVNQSACHDTNVVRALFGDPKRVLRTEILPVEPRGSWVTSLWDYGDAVCVFEGSLTYLRYWDESIWAYSPTKTVGLNFQRWNVKNAPPTIEVFEGTEREVSTKIVGRYDSDFQEELVHFIESIKTGKKPTTDAEDAKGDTVLASAMIKNYRSKQPIEI